MSRALQWYDKCDERGVMVWDISMSQTNNHNIRMAFPTILLAPNKENDPKNGKKEVG
jgi:hypothetical protein